MRRVLVLAGTQAETDAWRREQGLKHVEVISSVHGARAITGARPTRIVVVGTFEARRDRSLVLQEAEHCAAKVRPKLVIERLDREDS